MKDDSTPSSVVFPELVPPETTTFIRPRTHAERNASIRGPRLPFATSSSGRRGTAENLRTVTHGPRSERGGTIAWTRLPSGSRASAHGDDSSTRTPRGPTMRSIRCRTDSSPSNSPPGTLSSRPFRSTYTSSGPLTMTSVTSGSRNSGSIGPNPTTSSETSLTTRVSSRCGRMWPAPRRIASACSRTASRRSARDIRSRPSASMRSSNSPCRSRRTSTKRCATGIPPRSPRTEHADPITHASHGEARGRG